jgi:hypothetical protein
VGAHTSRSTCRLISQAYLLQVVFAQLRTFDKPLRLTSDGLDSSPNIAALLQLNPVCCSRSQLTWKKRHATLAALWSAGLWAVMVM